jgi:hypothetical protein
MKNAVRRRLGWLTLIPSLMVVGCSSDDQRLVDLSRQSLDRQAEQNRLVATNNQQVIDATKKLVEADAQSRHENMQLQHELQSERSGISQQRDALEEERREIAGQRNRDPIVAESIKTAAGLIVAALPLVVCLFLLRGLFHKSDDETVVDLLIEEFVARQPLFALSPNGILPSDDRPKSLSPRDAKAPPRLQVRGAIPADRSVGVVVVVEGSNDVEFLGRISRVLNRHDPAIPDLSQLEVDGQLTFLTASTQQLPNAAGSLGRQFHLYDRELPPVTDERRRLVDLLNRRPNCCAVLTCKRAIENYLHPDAISEAGGVEVGFGDFDDVGEIVAKATFQAADSSGWESLSRRTRRRLRDKAKKWLNREAVDRMTPERLAERDPDDEVIGWLRTIAELIGLDAETSA